ncbi:MAG: hypothetical protein AAF556_04620 [Pseudomonadota bacterium]
MQLGNIKYTNPPYCKSLTLIMSQNLPQTEPYGHEFDLTAAYQGQSLAAFDGALDDLRAAADALRRDEQPGRLGQDLEFRVVDAARTVQQHLLGQLRRPEPTNQLRALRADGPAADMAVDRLLKAASGFAKRSQHLLVMPSAGQFADTGRLDTLISAIVKLREVSPSLQQAGNRSEADPVTGLLSDPDPVAMKRFALETGAALNAIGDQLSGPKKIITDFDQQLALAQQIRPKLKQAIDALAETRALAEIGAIAKQISSPTERQTFVKDALVQMIHTDQTDEMLGTESGAIILPGNANGEAGRAAGLIITDDITAELDAVTTFEQRRNDPHMAKALIAFAEAHRGLIEQVDAIFVDGETQNGQLALTMQEDGHWAPTLTGRAKLGRAIASRTKIDALLNAQPIQGPETTAIILATTPQPVLELIQDSMTETLGAGYRGSKDWQDPVARLALDIEIAAANVVDQAEAIDAITNVRDHPEALDALQHAGLEDDAVNQLRQKSVVEAVIERFPASAAKIDAALGINIQRPDFAAMGVQLPTAPAPKDDTDAGPGLILPPTARR